MRDLYPECSIVQHLGKYRKTWTSSPGYEDSIIGIAKRLQRYHTTTEQRDYDTWDSVMRIPQIPLFVLKWMYHAECDRWVRPQIWRIIK